MSNGVMKKTKEEYMYKGVCGKELILMQYYLEICGTFPNWLDKIKRRISNILVKTMYKLLRH
jgi:hypothetical protein